MAEPTVTQPLTTTTHNLDADSIVAEVAITCTECRAALLDARGELLARLSCALCEELRKS